MSEELPVLIAALPQHTARELIEASRYGRDVWVPLEQLPTQEGPHMLEIYTAESDDPIRLIVEPLGMGNEKGSHLRLKARKKEVEKPRETLANGRFKLLSLIGKGAIGAVFQAQHTTLNRTVAVKLLHDAFQRDEEFCRRFYSEALAMSRLNHANLISVHDFGQEPDGLLYIAMAYVDGLSVRQLQKRESRKFDIPRIVNWMLQASAGLGHAHARGLIHRDVKPDNLMIVTEEDDDTGATIEVVKILDFGFAVPPSVSGEVAERLAGTPIYMSPEQCRGEELDERTDLYACGVIMYELAAGTVPFLDDDPAKVREMHEHAPVPLIASKRPDIDPRFERVVQRLLSKNRADRFANMKQFRAELKTLLAVESSPSLVPPPPASVPNLATPGNSFRPQPPPLPTSRKPPPPPPSTRDPEAGWLEHGTGSYDLLGPSQPTSGLAERLAKDPTAWLAELSRERNPRAFLKKIEDLDAAVQILAGRLDARTLVRVLAVVAGLVDGFREEAPKNALNSIARLLATPDVLAPIAVNFLITESEPNNPQREAAAKLIAQAGVAGAMTLYGARRKLPDKRGRVAFVTTMKALGPSARPVVRAALERIYEQTSSGQVHGGATELVEDVLLSVPNGDDDEAGKLILKFVSSKVPAIVRAAARALPRVSGIKARNVLLGLIAHEDDTVCLAAVVGLKELDSVDLEAVARMVVQIDAGRVRTQPLQLAFASALQSPTPSAQRMAANALVRMRAPRV